MTKQQEFLLDNHIHDVIIKNNGTDLTTAVYLSDVLKMYDEQVKNLSKANVIKSVCPTCKNEHEITDCNGYCSAACLQEDEGQTVL